MHNEAELSPSDQPKVRCFGSNAALTVEATPLLVKGVPHGHTVNLDVAPRQGENVIWARKITVQLSDNPISFLSLPHKEAVVHLRCQFLLARHSRYRALSCLSFRNKRNIQTVIY